MDQVSESRLSLVNPVLADKIRQLYSILAAENIFLRVTQGLRTWEEQDALYAQGRTTPGQKVTNARGGYSWHSFGCAVDLVPDVANTPEGSFIPDWNISHPAWKRMIEIGESLGLTSGSTWRTFPDFPHFQLTGNLGVSPTDEVRALFKEKGIKAIWDKIEV